MLSVKTFRSITEIDRSDWDSANIKKDYFKSHEFIKIIEESNIENSSFWYLLIYDDNNLIGATVFSSFAVSLDLFLGEQIRGAVKLIRKFLTNFLRVRFLFCGLPVSIGKDAILIKDAKHANIILETIVKEAKSIAESNKIKIINFKEFDLNNTNGLNSLLNLGFIKSRSIPYVDFINNHANFSEYLLALRHSYRRQIKRNMSMVNFEAVGIMQNELNPNHAILEIIDRGNTDANLLYTQYLNIIARADSVLETLNLDFFRNFLRESTQSKILILRKDTAIIGNAMLVEEGDKLTFILVGIQEEFRKMYASYFNILNAVIAYGIHNKFKKIGLGQTSYYTKLRMGGYTVPMVIYNYSTRKSVHFFLKILNNLIFPETKIQQHKVFKSPVKLESSVR